MTAAQLIERARARGVYPVVEGGQLRYVALRGHLDAELRGELERRAPEVHHCLETGDPAPTPLPLSTAEWPRYWREWFEERAAILEYDALLPRGVADQRARREVLIAFFRTAGGPS